MGVIKMTKRKTYESVQLVQKYKNGKIVKNESYKVPDFVAEILPPLNGTVVTMKITFEDFLFRRVKKKQMAILIQERQRARKEAVENIAIMIHKDKVGKSKRK